MSLIRSLLITGLILICCTAAGLVWFSSSRQPTPIQGVCMVAPPSPFPKDPMEPLRQLGAEWVAVVPFGYSLQGDTQVFFDVSRQWWGEKTEGAKKSIQLAKSTGLSVMLKPQIYVPGSWPGEIGFSKEAEWEAWESDYRQYLLHMAQLAGSLSVDMLCIGTEFKKSTQHRPQFWRQLIRDVRKEYRGPLTYAANWDEYQTVPFWDELDYIGVDAYFPLVNKKTPSVSELVQAWTPWKRALLKTSRKWSRPVLFTEFGYLSVDSAAYRTWEREVHIHTSAINEFAQANAYQAVFEVFWEAPFWAGGFIWKWFPNMQGHEGYPEKDYTPQGKKAEQTLRNWYFKE